MLTTDMDKKADSADFDETGFDRSTEDELGMSYRSISKSAIASAIFAVLGLTFLISITLIILPAIALGLGLVGLSNIRKYPEELVGRRMAKFGLVVSFLVLACGVSWHLYVYMTEVPDGYQRISFRMLKTTKIRICPIRRRQLNWINRKFF